MIDLTQNEIEFIKKLFDGSFSIYHTGIWTIPMEWYWIARSLELKNIVYIKKHINSSEPLHHGSNNFIMVLEKTSGIINEIQIMTMLEK